MGELDDVVAPDQNAISIESVYSSWEFSKGWSREVDAELGETQGSPD